MTLREQIQARIAELDEAVLPDVMRELDLLEERLSREFPQDFLDMLAQVRERNSDLSPEEAEELANEAVAWARKTHAH
ncbi:MAG: hypothetical protein AAF267_22005 [Deinococcota bacterium]